MTTSTCNILLEGNIGSGKSEFISYLRSLTDITLIPEPVNEWTNYHGYNMLEMMYKSPGENTFAFQSLVLLKQWKLFQKQVKSIRMFERSPFSSFYVFVESQKHLLKSYEYELLAEWFDFVTNTMEMSNKINLVVYIRTDPLIAYERTRKRDRKGEESISLETITKIHNLHENWLIKKEKPIPGILLTIDGNQDRGSMEMEALALYNAIKLTTPRHGTVRTGAAACPAARGQEWP